MKPLARLIRRLALALQTDRASIGPVGRIWRTIVLVPFFGGWWLLALAYSRLRGPIELQATTHGGNSFHCRLPDLVDMYVYLFGVWEPDLSAYIQRGLAPGRAFIDVGAHIGYFSMLAGGAVAPGGSVVAFEPNSDTHGRLVANAASNGQSAVRCLQLAVAEEDGELVLYHGPPNNSGLATTLESRGFDVSERVAARTPRDALTREEIAAARLIKIDVEGAEPPVLKAFAELLAELPDDVEFIIEVSPHWWTTGDTMKRTLAPYLAAGFNVYELDNNYWPWRYLWPHVVSPPTSRSDAAAGLTRRADLVLSRSSSPTL